jgi:hypothetical protein
MKQAPVLCARSSGKLEEHLAFLKSRPDVRRKFPDAVERTESNLVYTSFASA